MEYPKVIQRLKSQKEALLSDSEKSDVPVLETRVFGFYGFYPYPG
jgi:hypothetical protein